jgi:hypothetical protein
VEVTVRCAELHITTSLDVYNQPALLEALKTSGPVGRGWAASLLLGYPSSAIYSALLDATKDPSADVRAKAAIT